VDQKWQQGMEAFCKPLTESTIRYFDRANAVEARQSLGDS
jgi:hypothetical protein